MSCAFCKVNSVPSFSGFPVLIGGRYTGYRNILEVYMNENEGMESYHILYPVTKEFYALKTANKFSCICLVHFSLLRAIYNISILVDCWVNLLV